MTLEALIRECQNRQKVAEETGQLLDGAKTYASFVEKLRTVDALPAPDKAYTTAEVGLKLGLSAETVAGYCRADSFPNAYRTSAAVSDRNESERKRKGRWRIPAADVAAFIRAQSDSKSEQDERDPLDDFDQYLER